MPIQRDLVDLEVDIVRSHMLSCSFMRQLNADICLLSLDGFCFQCPKHRTSHTGAAICRIGSSTRTPAATSQSNATATKKHAAGESGQSPVQWTTIALPILNNNRHACSAGKGNSECVGCRDMMSCLMCTRSKCDEGRPCMACFKSNLDCIYNPNGPPRYEE
jgi:hypothetical protein